MTLAQYVETQQVTAMNLHSVINALHDLMMIRMAPDAQKELISVALVMSSDLNTSLDSVNLPEGGAA